MAGLATQMSGAMSWHEILKKNVFCHGTGHPMMFKILSKGVFFVVRLGGCCDFGITHINLSIHPLTWEKLICTSQSLFVGTLVSHCLFKTSNPCVEMSQNPRQTNPESRNGPCRQNCHSTPAEERANLQRVNFYFARNTMSDCSHLLLIYTN